MVMIDQKGCSVMANKNNLSIDDDFPMIDPYRQFEFGIAVWILVK
jgi:hypothetical protein